ncbi:MAG: L,D-transpeptidase [Phycisphaerae bacterium]|jgi:lipoprotein-anchoring transpeptidase ErfK/SrfK|nr:L,D-transpeptidase [Phycisphaerae bacterium]
MRKRTLYYLVSGGAGLLVMAGVVIASRSFIVSLLPGPVDHVAAPADKGAPPVPANRPHKEPTGSAGSYQMNPPEAGLVGCPKTAGSKVEKQPTATRVSKPPQPVAPKAPVKTAWLKPAPVDSKDLPLGPLMSPSILVEKSALRLTVFDGDASVKSYRIAAGAVRGDKQIEGDRKTPEGDFYICIRKTTGQTPYTRSMGLSYPNIEDARRGRRQGLITAAQYSSITEAINNKRKPPWQTKLGGAIMIHGKREGRTGTLGCVALDDADVLELYKRLPLNTPVRIIP